MAKGRKTSKKAGPATRRKRSSAKQPATDQNVGKRQLIVIVKPELEVRSRRAGIRSAAGADISPLSGLIASEEITLEPLFGSSEERVRARSASVAAQPGTDAPDLSIFYKVDAPDERLDEIAERLLETGQVEAAYVKPPAELPVMINDMVPRAEPSPPTTPDFTSRQTYLDAAPGGIDARYAWTLNGGRGASVRVIDIEGAWRFSHEDLLANQGGVVGGTQSPNIDWRNHGTAVVGEIGGDVNSIGITGISPDANVRAVSVFTNAALAYDSAKAIKDAADKLLAGDIILIEQHRAGPRFNFQSRLDQRGYIAIEWWEDDFAAIRYASNKGIIVVEAAGNGAENLDDAIYNTRPAGFPAAWTNPFNRSNRDSGAVVVGAGAPPPGTHGADHGPDRSRLDFSNYGALLDAQGWGREVTTAGYGSLQGGSEDEWYTDTFSGTSSASPIVVGALACVQGVRRARGEALITPAQARADLRATGSPQQDAPGRPTTQRIGNRPNLRQLIPPKPKPKEKDKEFDKNIGKEIRDLTLEKRNVVEKLAAEFDWRIDWRQFVINQIWELELRQRLQQGLLGQQALTPSAGASTEERLARLEAAVSGLTHFIGPELRPDLSAGALNSEPDAGGATSDLSRQLFKQSSDAKQAKDNKDVEKLREV